MFPLQREWNPVGGSGANLWFSTLRPFFQGGQGLSGRQPQNFHQWLSWRGISGESSGKFSLNTFSVFSARSS